MRQDEPLVRSYAVTHPAGEVALPTDDGWDHVIYASAGVLIASTEDGRWTIPPHRALLVPARLRTLLTTGRPASVHCLYLRTDLGLGLDTVAVVDVEPLTRELLLDAVGRSPLSLEGPAERALVTLLIDRLSSAQVANLRLPIPLDPRARRVAESILADPAAPLGAALADAGASRRTIERLFVADTLLTLAGWRRRARVLAAVELLTAGRSVTEAAVAAGYATPSSFGAAFRLELDASPRSFRL